MPKRPDYGIDSPRIIAVLAVLGGAALSISVALFSLTTSSLSKAYIAALCLAIAIYFMAGVGGMLWYSKVGKLRIREEMLNQIPWRGDERVLDVGCGRGLAAVGAARRLTTGKVVGVDVWIRSALSGNGPEQVLENARREGVADRVEATKGDVRQLPFAENTFAAVVSNFVLHELPTPAEREKMLREMVRVLKPGGQLVLVDFIFTVQAVQVLGEHGMTAVRRSRVGPLVAWIITAILNVGLVRTYLITGHKALS
jgi:SAM-dependent methyltransferase